MPSDVPVLLVLLGPDAPYNSEELWATREVRTRAVNALLKRPEGSHVAVRPFRGWSFWDDLTEAWLRNAAVVEVFPGCPDSYSAVLIFPPRSRCNVAPLAVPIIQAIPPEGDTTEWTYQRVTAHREITISKETL